MKEYANNPENITKVFAESTLIQNTKTTKKKPKNLQRVQTRFRKIARANLETKFSAVKKFFQNRARRGLCFAKKA
jgi:hypothetical protein